MKNSEKILKEERSLSDSSPRRSSISYVRTTAGFKQSMSLNLKILMNYIQIITIMQEFEMKWPFYARNYLKFFASMGGGLSPQVISFDCVFDDHDINIYSLYAQTFVMSLLPLAIYVIAGVVLLVFFFTTRNPQMIRFIVVLIVVSLFLQPSIINTLFQNLSCRQIDNGNYLTKNLDISCDSDSYKNWVILGVFNSFCDFNLISRCHFLFFRLLLFGALCTLLFAWGTFSPKGKN